MIPDIALMIVVYGSVRLITGALAPYRLTGRGDAARIATILHWFFAAAGTLALAVLGVMVLQSSASLSDLTR